MKSIQEQIYLQRAGLNEQTEQTELTEQAEQLDEIWREPDITDMGRSELWSHHANRHLDAHDFKDRPEISEPSKKSAENVYNHVLKTHGKDMADAMHKHSELYVQKRKSGQSAISNGSPDVKKHDDAQRQLRKQHKIKPRRPGSHTANSWL